MNRLEASGLVEYRPNKEHFVGEITETEATQLYQAREALEIWIRKEKNGRVVQAHK
jgi:DNA-binding GntR family transcriptional regulator